MTNEVKEFAKAQTNNLLAAPMACKEVKEQAQRWLDALGTDDEAAQTKQYVAQLEGDIMPIDQLIGFAQSEHGAALFGAEKAKEVADHAISIKAKGAKFCDCPACAACEAILSKKDALLA